MCGITGLINIDNKPVSIELLKRMTDSIAHRGPDAEGFWRDKGVGIGHRRLSIIDTTFNGNQPMCSKDGRYILSYNGEIYNYKELKKELISDGVKFSGNSDTEVVLNALINWKESALLKFNGMFALAFWDCKDEILFLARDRYGIKPLYYSIQGKTFAFGSEQKAIILTPNFKLDINKSALLEYFTFQNIFTDQTLLKDIKLLPAGHFLKFNKKNFSMHRYKYWDYNFQEPNQKANEKEYIEELDRLFQQAVKRQLISDVEVGAYLSGGMDSGSITAIAAKHIPGIKTFTCGFDVSSASGLELAFDERQKAEFMSAKFKTEHYEMVLKAGDMERCLKKLSWHLEEPRVGQSYPNFYAAQLCSKFVKVVLSGSGGDELFAGYPWRYYRTVNSQNFEHFVDEYYVYWQRLVSNSELKKLFSPIWNNVKDVWTRNIFRDVFLKNDSELSKPEDYINQSLYFEAKTFLHGLFVVEDKLSMAHGLENRVPFMDNDLVDFAMKCPVGLKLNKLSEVLRINENETGNKKNKYFLKTNDGKQILRKTMERIIPKEILKAKKQGFSSPDASWFKGESIGFLKRKLFHNDARIYNFIDKSETQSLVKQHLSGEVNHRLFIWSLLYFEDFLSNTFG